MGYAKLSDEVKTFIVQALACDVSPSEVAARVSEEFGVEISRQQVQRYDPDRVAGEQLGKKYVDLFFATRDQFLAEMSKVPVAHRAIACGKSTRPNC